MNFCLAIFKVVRDQLISCLAIFKVVRDQMNSCLVIFNVAGDQMNSCLAIFKVAGDQINSCWLFSMLQETKYNCKKIATKKREQYLFGGDCILRIENQAGFATIFS